MKKIARFATAALLIVMFVSISTGSAAAKGGWGWHLWDRDGFFFPGQQVRAEASFPDTKPYPTHAWLIEIDWEAQPRSMPRERISLGTLAHETFRLRGQRLVGVALTFTAPSEPGDYVIVTCAQPCRDISTYPAPSSVNVVADTSEARLRLELSERDASIGRLGSRLLRTRAELRDLQRQMDRHLSYLSNHVTRIGDLEEALVVARRDPPRSDSTGIWAGLIGTALGWAVARRPKGRPAASSQRE